MSESISMITRAPSNEPIPQMQVASAPFNRSDADLVICSSDHVEFHVHCLILSMASSVFEGMLSVPSPPTASSTPFPPVITIPEDSETLNIFLRVCYPFVDPEVPTLPLLRKVLAAAVKYDAPMVIHAMERELRQPRFVESDPLRVFAIACLYDLEEAAKVAAEAAVIADAVTRSASSCPELEEINAGAYYRLLKLNRTRTYRRRSGTYCVSFDRTPFCRRPVSNCTSVPTGTAAQFPFTPQVDGADIILRTADGVDFYAHRTLITFASPTFLGTLVSHELGERPVYLLSEEYHTANALLRMAYPMDVPDIHCPDLYLDVALAAHKYRFRKVEQMLRLSWSDYATHAPLRFYFAAVQCEWEKEARTCARQLATTFSPGELDDAYVPEMETASSVPYRRLLSYAQACREAAINDFDLVDLPSRQCASSSACHTRYPTTVSTGNPPSWLFARLGAARRALKIKPSGTVLHSQLEVGGTLMKAIITELCVPSCQTTAVPTATSRPTIPAPPVQRGSPSSGNAFQSHRGVNGSVPFSTIATNLLVTPPTTSSSTIHATPSLGAPRQSEDSGLLGQQPTPSVQSSSTAREATFLPQCTQDHTLEWIIQLLQKYAAAVDKAVSEVELVL